MGAPGCPLLACWTASIAKVRIVLMHSVSSCFPVTTACSLATMPCALLPGANSTLAWLLHWLVLLEFPGQKGFQVRIECTNFLRTNVAGSAKRWRENAEMKGIEETALQPISAVAGSCSRCSRLWLCPGRT